MTYDEIDTYLGVNYGTDSGAMENRYGEDWSELIKRLEIEGLTQPDSREEFSDMKEIIDRFMVDVCDYTRKRKRYLRMGL
jgi:hypothetical protein